jgi:HAD superfamily 5'-nucleotidase-like hydrolase
MEPSDESSPPRQERGIYCNRTLNLRAIRAIGYDMDYTLVHYRAEQWERRAFEHCQRRLAEQGWPTEDLSFDGELVIRGLIIDTELGNLVKANRFGFIKRAFHGTKLLGFEEQRATYARTMIDLAEPRWIFLNTLFSISEGCMYAKLVDRLDERRIPAVIGYEELYRRVRETVDAAHMEGQLKGEIMADPARFVDRDPETVLTLLDQKDAGKKLLLVTNSDWIYTRSMMSYAFDEFLPSGMTWRSLFDLVILDARKPEFFSGKSPLFEVVTEDGLLRSSVRSLRDGGSYVGGNAALIEEHLGLSGDEILYVGDHIYGDVHVSKSLLRWRTAVILRDLEGEIAALLASQQLEARLSALMHEKEALEFAVCQARLKLQRIRSAYGPPVVESPEALHRLVSELRARLAALDAEIAPLAKATSELDNPYWGPLMRAGNDKSHLARQVERSADIYTSRVSNFLAYTPFIYLRSPRGSLPHDLSDAPREVGGVGDSGD